MCPFVWLVFHDTQNCTLLYFLCRFAAVVTSHVCRTLRLWCWWTNLFARHTIMGMTRQPKASALNAVFAYCLPSTRIGLPIRIFRHFVSCPSLSTSLLIAHMIHPADALPSSSRELSDAASMSLPSLIHCIISSNHSFSGGKSVSICWKTCCCIWSSATTRCIFA